MISLRGGAHDIVTVNDTLIAIVDDDDSLRTALVSLVRSLGYRANGFPTAEAFFADAEGALSDAIITDIQMPGLSGIELKERLTAESCIAPVIMITARGEPGLTERAVASGAFCVLRKPFVPEALIACLERALVKAT